MKYRQKLQPMKSWMTALQEYGLPKSGCNSSPQTDEPIFRPDDSTLEDLLPLFQRKLQAAVKPVQIEIVQKLFDICCIGVMPVTADYIQNSICAMERLKLNGKSNVIGGLAQALGMVRPDGSDSRFPIQRMLFGLLEHCVNFFNAKSINMVSTSI